MRRVLSLDGQDRSVRVRREGSEGALRLTIEGVEGELTAHPAPGGWTIVHGRRTAEAGVAGGRSGELVVQIAGHTFRFRTGREAAGASRPGQSRSRGPGGSRCEVRTPMPGKVVRLLREEGDRVAAGDGVLVLEAMKMQNEIRAPEDGVVANMKVAAGTLTEGGELLFVVEPAGSA